MKKVLAFIKREYMIVLAFIVGSHILFNGISNTPLNWSDYVSLTLLLLVIYVEGRPRIMNFINRDKT
jgi:hypothetical protein